MNGQTVVVVLDRDDFFVAGSPERTQTMGYWPS